MSTTLHKTRTFEVLVYCGPDDVFFDRRVVAVYGPGGSMVKMPLHEFTALVADCVPFLMGVK